MNRALLSHLWWVWSTYLGLLDESGSGDLAAIKSGQLAQSVPGPVMTPVRLRRARRQVGERPWTGGRYLTSLLDLVQLIVSVTTILVTRHSHR